MGRARRAIEALAELAPKTALVRRGGTGDTVEIPVADLGIGDVVGLVNATALAPGHTLYVDRKVEFPPIPSFAPEHFSILRAESASKYKQFRKAIDQLDSEGVVQVLRSMDRALRIVGVPTTSDKFGRAQAVAAAWNQGRVRLPPEAPWLADFVRVVTGFTGVRDRHDDDVDALSVGWNHAVRVVAGRLGVVRSLPRLGLPSSACRCRRRTLSNGPTKRCRSGPS